MVGWIGIGWMVGIGSDRDLRLLDLICLYAHARARAHARIARRTPRAARTATSTLPPPHLFLLSAYYNALPHALFYYLPPRALRARTRWFYRTHLFALSLAFARTHCARARAFLRVHACHIYYVYYTILYYILIRIFSLLPPHAAAHAHARTRARTLCCAV